MDPRKIGDGQRAVLEKDALEVLFERWKAMKKPTSQGYGLFHRATEVSEPDAAGLIGVDYTTLKRIRRAGCIPYTPKGQKGAVYLVWHLVHYHLFGRQSVVLWGGELPGGESQQAAE